MSKKASNVKVTSRECRGNHEKMIRRFIKKCKKEKIVEEFRENAYFEKPSTKRRRAKMKKLRNAQKAEMERSKKYTS